MKNQLVILILAVAAVTVSAFGQGRDSFYPFTVECSQASAAAGEAVTFAAKFPAEAKLEKYKFKWTVSAGAITEGQGTLSITVSTSRDMEGHNITATMELDSDTPIYPGSQKRADCTLQLRTGPKPKLIDSFTQGTCEDGLRAMDYLFNGLANNPAAEGVVVIYADKSHVGRSRAQVRELNRWIKTRRFDPARIRLVEAEFRDNPQTEFWMVPPGAVMPEIAPLDRPHAVKSPEPSEPYIYGMETWDGIPECKVDEYDVAGYGTHLKKNPKHRGNIVIASTSYSRFVTKKRGILTALKRAGVSATRFRIVFKKVNDTALSESVELWVIPSGV